jgi:uncharacterized SAM-binding protein YcdF (DUF218 family)
MRNGNAVGNRRYSRLLILFVALPSVAIVIAPQLARSLDVSHMSVQPSDYVVILGNRPRYQQLSVQGRERLDVGLELAAAWPSSLIVVAGGETVPGLTESRLMRNYLESHGIPSDRIIEESQSRDTWENIRNVRTLVPPDARTVIVTSGYHSYRVEILATQAHFPAEVVAPARDSVSHPETFSEYLSAAFWTYRELGALSYFEVRMRLWPE